MKPINKFFFVIANLQKMYMIWRIQKLQNLNNVFEISSELKQKVIQKY